MNINARAKKSSKFAVVALFQFHKNSSDSINPPQLHARALLKHKIVKSTL